MISTFARSALASASLALMAHSAIADDARRAGAWTAQVSQQEARLLGVGDHVIVSQVSQGVNRSTGSEPIGDGGHVLISETLELKDGSGPQHGLYSLVDDEGSTTARFEGRITTTMADGKPRTTGEGTWRYVSSSGAYQGATGTGTYRFTMTSPTDHSGEWRQDVESAQR